MMCCMSTPALSKKTQEWQRASKKRYSSSFTEVALGQEKIFQMLPTTVFLEHRSKKRMLLNFQKFVYHLRLYS
ncbi:hypothetical protein GOP47_0023008 [Adiantum capillus-veneris]|uniref:Uncharacterized protein n=1 Tax=Adiantum capillus-veneris TaxID=13818 RepID=A0A9D4Z5V9_ADICA|nr:hypothetical protein GOP47_0023008 [Adiantum capillus-veneris]